MMVELVQTDRLLRRRIVTFREHEGKGWRRSVEIHMQRLHPPSEVLTLLGEIGFRPRRGDRSRLGRPAPRPRRVPRPQAG